MSAVPHSPAKGNATTHNTMISRPMRLSYHMLIEGGNFAREC